MQKAHAEPKAQGRKATKDQKPALKQAWSEFRAGRIRKKAGEVMRETTRTSAEKKAHFLLERHLKKQMWYVPTELVAKGFLLEIAHTDKELGYWKKWGKAPFEKHLDYGMPIAVNFALSASPKQKRDFVKLVRSHPAVTAEALISLSNAGYRIAPKILAIKAQEALSRIAREQQTSADRVPSVPSRADSIYGGLVKFLYSDEAKERLESCRQKAVRDIEDSRKKAA